MKKFRLMNAAIMVAGLSLALTACDPESEVKTGIVTFEDVALGTNGVWNGSDMTGSMTSYLDWGMVIHAYSGSFNSNILNCPNSFYQDQSYFSTWWSGMACTNHNDTDSIGHGNQYSVYAPAGAAGSTQFALIGSDSAQCSFSQPTIVKSLMYNNSTYVYWALKEGKDGAGYVRKFSTGDYFYVTVNGYDADGIKTGQVIMTLADFRNTKSYICSDWTKLSLAPLGKVKSLEFVFTSSDLGDYGMNTPAYVCIDNIVYEK